MSFANGTIAKAAQKKTKPAGTVPERSRMAAIGARTRSHRKDGPSKDDLGSGATATGCASGWGLSVMTASVIPAGPGEGSTLVLEQAAIQSIG
jgi:hypothetical protein